MRNILFVMADQLRFDALGFVGRFPVRTPNIDKLAENGTVFRNAYCANPVCVPARASLMTGVYSYDHGVYYNDQNWPARLDTIPRSLSSNCYYTVHIGKKHIFPQGRSIGFHKLALQQPPSKKRRTAARGKASEDSSWHEVNSLNRAYRLEPTTAPRDDYGPVYYTNKVLHELDLIAQRRECHAGGNEPFFMKVSYAKPHNPCDPPEPYFSMYHPEDLPAPIGNEDEIQRFSSQVRTWYDIWDQMDEERVLKHRAQYLGCVTLVDEQVGRIVEKLKELNIYDNTLVIFTSDHGDHLCDHHLQQKAFFYESSARVPFIFSGPGVPAGNAVDENVSHIDLYPTLMDYCSLAMPRHRDESRRLIYPDTYETDAVSLMPYFAGEGEVYPDRIVISENAICGQRFMLKKGDVKVNYYVNANSSDEWDYYDLSVDPDELQNQNESMSLDDLEPDVRKQIKKVLEKTERHKSGHYYFQGKVRRMFT